MNPKLQSLYGLKFNPFRPDVLDRELPRLDEKLYLEAFAQPAQKKAGGSSTRKR
jgi:hypothetical protein